MSGTVQGMIVDAFEKNRVFNTLTAANDSQIVIIYSFL